MVDMNTGVVNIPVHSGPGPGSLEHLFNGCSVWKHSLLPDHLIPNISVILTLMNANYREHKTDTGRKPTPFRADTQQ